MEVTIEKLVYGGDGLARQDGETIFVPHVLPGEVVEIRAVERRKKFVRGRVARIKSASEQRVAPACRHFTQCGGCHYQHIGYTDQLQLKSEILRETLRRIGRITWTEEITLHPSPPLGYRNRAQWKVRPAGERASLGYFQPASSALCVAEECPVLSPRLEAALAALRALVESSGLPGTVREMEAYVDSEDAQVALNISCADFSTPPRHTAQAIQQAVEGVASLLLYDASREKFELFGPGFLTWRSGGREFRVGHLSFFQANRFLVEELALTATEAAAGDLALDLYAGVGLFSAALAKKFARVVAVESNEAAARDLQHNLAGLDERARAVHGDVAAVLKNWREQPSLVLLDPPRTGVESAALERVAALAAPELRYVSCDPATLARDLAALHNAGYALRALHLFDLFPQTFHIETLAILRRGS